MLVDFSFFFHRENNSGSVDKFCILWSNQVWEWEPRNGNMGMGTWKWKLGARNLGMETREMESRNENLGMRLYLCSIFPGSN